VRLWRLSVQRVGALPLFSSPKSSLDIQHILAKHAMYSSSDSEARFQARIALQAPSPVLLSKSSLAMQFFLLVLSAFRRLRVGELGDHEYHGNGG
jgi:hypothetical protein